MKMSELRRLKEELDEVIELRENMQATHTRCNELLNAYRSLRYVLEECDVYFETHDVIDRETDILRNKIKLTLERLW